VSWPTAVHRYYDPATGQFLTIDPLVDQTEKAYAYAGDDPIDSDDPNGELNSDGGAEALNWYVWDSPWAWDMFGHCGPGVVTCWGAGGNACDWTCWTLHQSPAETAMDFIPGGAFERLVARVGKALDDAFGAYRAYRDTRLTASESRAIASLEKRIAEHEAKLAAYRANPDAYDNLGILARAPSEAVRNQIIQGRIAHLEHEITTFKNAIAKIKNK
jgi:hypothetical protein